VFSSSSSKSLFHDFCLVSFDEYMCYIQYMFDVRMSFGTFLSASCSLRHGSHQQITNDYPRSNYQGFVTTLFMEMKISSLRRLLLLEGPRNGHVMLARRS
jgi:hypothetical protein